MSQEQFILSDWVDRLSDCLQDLVSYERSLESELLLLRQQGEIVLGLPGRFRYDSKNSILERVSGYSLFALRESGSISEYRQTVSQKLGTLLKVLLEHPTIGDAADTSDDEWVLGLDLAVSRNSEHQMVFMLRGLIEHALEHTPQTTANALAEVMLKGENHDLSSYSILLFRGLHVERRQDFQGGLSIISFEEARQFLSDSMAQSLVGEGTDVGREPLGAVVSEVKWGPAIVPAGYDMDWEWPDRSNTFRDDALLLIDLLAVTHVLPVVSTGRHTSVVERQVEHLVGRGPSFPSWMLRDVPGVNTLNSAPPTTPTVSKDRLPDCAQLLSDMPKGDVILRLALTRLASSLSRKGIHAAFDRIIDVAIALEVMYQLDAPRGKGDQLSRRARHLVGQDREDRNWIKRTAKTIFKVRNDIAHGRLPEDTSQAHLDALELARRTLAHLVRWGRPSDWEKPNCSN